MGHLRESGYYPPGAEFDANAPWNQVDPPEVDFTIKVGITLEKECVITTDEVYNDDGDWCLCDDADVEGAYKETYKPIPDMLDELVKYIDGELLGDISKERRRELELMKESAQGWTEEYFEFERD